jgi:hypothetical protein
LLLCYNWKNLWKSSDVISINICTIVEKSNISCKFRENYFRIDCPSIFVSVIVKELTLIYDIYLAFLNDTVTLIVYSSTSPIPKDIITWAWVIALGIVMFESRFRYRQKMRIINKDRSTSDSSTIFKNRLAYKIFAILICTLFGYLCLLNKDCTALSALDIFKLWSRDIDSLAIETRESWAFSVKGRILILIDLLHCYLIKL